jgi:hypothetical protein
LSHKTSPFYFSYFWDRVSLDPGSYLGFPHSWDDRHVPPCSVIDWAEIWWIFCLGWPWVIILLISTSQVSRITGVNYSLFLQLSFLLASWLGYQRQGIKRQRVEMKAAYYCKNNRPATGNLRKCPVRVLSLKKKRETHLRCTWQLRTVGFCCVERESWQTNSLCFSLVFYFHG